MADPTASQTKLIQYLNEAYGKERELETALQAHIAMTTRAPYKKRLQQHLKETKAHARSVQSRIKKLGGKAEIVDAPGPDVITRAASGAVAAGSKAVAAAQGPLHMLRGTGEQEKMLKNAQTEYQEEAREIAMYSAIETMAEVVGDRETAKLARDIKREEERMSKFLASQIETLTKAVAQEEIPAAERRTTRRRRSSASRSSSSRQSSSSRSSGSRSSGSRSSGSRKSSSSRSSGSRSSGSRSRSRRRSGSS